MKAGRLLFRILFLFLAAVAVYYFYPEKKLPANAIVDEIVVKKSERKLLAYSKGKLLKAYTISLGENPRGAKQIEGDNKTPEGIYIINDKNPNSGYHKNLGISYPNKEDIKKAKALAKPTGGDIKIHGLKNGQGYIGKFQRWSDWTLGCIALSDEEVDELYRSVAVGTKVEIKP